MQTKKLRLMNEKNFKKSCKPINTQIQMVVFWVQASGRLSCMQFFNTEKLEVFKLGFDNDHDSRMLVLELEPDERICGIRGYKHTTDEQVYRIWNAQLIILSKD